VLAVAVLAVLAAGGIGFAAPAAAAPTITQQGAAGHPFTWTSLPSALEVVDADEGDQDLRLALTAVDRIARGSSIYGDESCDARSVEALDSGNLLFSDRSLPIVAEVTRAGEPVWTYSADDDSSLQRPFSAQRFTRGGQDLTLISDRDAKRVWVVDEEKRVVWQYGVIDEEGMGVNHLLDPFCARYSELDGGTVVIADTLGASRVIVVRYGDYVAGAPDNGFTEESIVWSYGTPGSAGSGPGQLDKPHGVDRLANGNILVADEDAQRVIEIDWETKEISWKYGTTDQAGDGAGQLKEPNAARRLSDGDTLIADAGNARVLRVSANGAIDREYDMEVLARPPWHAENDPSSPRQAVYTNDGLLVVADSLFQQIVLLGHEGAGQAISTPLDCGQPGVKKAFVSLTWQGDTGPSGTGVAIDYKLDGEKSWQTCAFRSGLRRFEFKAGTVGRTIAYRVTLSSAHAGHTPTLDSVVIQSTTATTGGSGGGGGGAEGGAGNSGQSGVYMYPSIAEGGTGTSGTGTGSGGSGTGSGSGSSGTGTGSSSAGGGSSTVTNSVDVPVQSTGSGETQAVQGYEIQGQEGVSGVPLRAVEGPQAPEPERPGPPVPVLALIGAGLVVAAAFFGPWPLVAAHMRRITGFDHTRPRRSLPFRPLGR
jgi:hypothetical protein